MSRRYREIEVSGRPLEMGRQLGEAAREEIRGFVGIALERTQKTVAVSPAAAMGIARGCIEFAEGYAPDMVEELRGVGEGSGVALEELMLIQVRNQLRDEGGCTAFSLGGAVTGGPSLVGQNWDNDPALDPFTIVLTRRPKGKPAIMDVTQAGLIAYIGLNEAGIGLCMNTLPAPSRPLGVPHYFTVRGIYESRSLEEAVEAVRRAERAIPANIILATPQGPADLEVTVERVYLLRDEGGSGMVTHTNHCLHPELAGVSEAFPELIESKPRKRRIDDLLKDLSRPLRLEELKKALVDHDGHPRSICRHANDHPENGFWVSVFSVIIEADAGRMHVSRGNPCENPYEVYTLN